MGASFTINISFLKKMKERLSHSGMKACINRALQERAVAGLVGQAIADNFAQEGPGWQPLKAKTIRQSLAKKLRKSIADLSDEELLKHEAKARKKESEEEPNRRILDRTGLLKKTVTMPGFSGSSKAKKGQKSVSGRNIFKVEGTRLIWGTDLIYAGVHQKGNKAMGIPARPYLKLTPQWAKQIQEYVFQRALKQVKNVVTGGGT